VVERALLSNEKDFGITLFFGSPPGELSTVASDDVLRRAFEAVRDEVAASLSRTGRTSLPVVLG
jgi:hypothetical protein